ncbi:MAG: LysR family transcriptional regulator [Rhodobiaceae bacterium]|nr:LysR family transcriptional regulator [Rhodobiaceae bacterium]MCC0015798.1 LysR family transcriptional regulator [Rhodobiaceae bacterium]MCC0040583.1 LysR family transcriptional regulator [Rhodobiaceae bacterium]MCC0054056.1 LysR family transcriptional regulator [Rhodobiaceae bacterium]
METRQLRQFIAIAEEGSLSAAAVRIGVAQPSLSQLLKTLEQGLGVDLVVRSPKGITLTDAGQLLLGHAREIVAATDRAVEEVRMSGTEIAGTVSFGLPSSVSMVLSVPLAETVRLTLPRVSLRAVEAMSGFIREWLMNESIDIGILYEIDTLKNVKARLLLTEELHFFAAPDAWPLDQPPGRPVTLAEAARQELVLPSTNHGLRMLIDRSAKASGVNLNVVLEMDALTQIKSLVARGSGSCILAPAAAHDFLASGQMVSTPIVDPVIRRPVYLVRNAAKTVSRASMEVERLTLEVIDDLVRRNIWKGRITQDTVTI